MSVVCAPATPVWADPRAHRVTRVASDLIERTGHGRQETKNGSSQGGVSGVGIGGAPRSTQGRQGTTLENPRSSRLNRRRAWLGRARLTPQRT
jgi:hypothetical protein